MGKIKRTILDKDHQLAETVKRLGSENARLRSETEVLRINRQKIVEESRKLFRDLEGFLAFLDRQEEPAPTQSLSGFENWFSQCQSLMPTEVIPGDQWYLWYEQRMRPEDAVKRFYNTAAPPPVKN